MSLLPLRHLAHDRPLDISNGAQRRGLALLHRGEGPGPRRRQGYALCPAESLRRVLTELLADPPKFDFESYIANYQGSDACVLPQRPGRADTAS